MMDSCLASAAIVATPALPETLLSLYLHLALNGVSEKATLSYRPPFQVRERERETDRREREIQRERGRRERRERERERKEREREKKREREREN